jgi:amino acid adenylation domain-containing protein
MLDGWSARLVLDEVLDRTAGRAVAPVRPFRDHVAWIAAQDADAAETHWRSLLDGFDAPTRIAVDRGRSSAPFQLARTTAELDEAATAELEHVARTHRVTVNTLVQAAWATVLSCLSGDDDVVFGVTGSGRPAEIDDVEDIIGMFLATLPMRVRFDGERPVAEWWAELQRQQLDLTHYQYSSLADVARWSEVPAGVPLFDSTVVFENFPSGNDDETGLTVEARSVYEQTRFPLTLMIGPGARLEVLTLFDESRFDRSDVDSLVAQFLLVLERMTREPDLPLRSLTVLGDDELRRILVDWNRTDRAVPDATVHAEIERRAAANPGALAVIDGERRWSFGELVDAAARLAARMQAAGAAPGQAIGVALPRSIEAVVALLAVIRSGAAYVPLEPGTPRARLDLIAEAADITMALTTSEHASSVSGRGIPVIDVTEADSTLVPIAATDEVAPDDPMFVVFTSGSTGTPKGVPGSHRAVLNRCAWQTENHPFADDEIMCQKTTLGFVDHVAELWAPLVSGKPLVIVPDEVVRDVEAFVTTLAHHEIRRIVMVPSLLTVILDSVPDLATRLPRLRLWNLSGERLPRLLADRFRSALPDASLLNIYGMSEAMADATCFDGVWSESDETLPIGRPIRNHRVYVLDRVGRPTPVGVAGQIWISGVGLAAGYWRRDDLTAERFGPNPFGDGHHGRRYATGDVGRWRPDGQLEYLGRIDRQVKVNGIRVELGDVEAAVRELPGVRDVVVIDVSSANASSRLVAHVVTDGVVDPVDLRRQLSERVPEYLVPAALHRIDAIPLLPSGKPDRHSLPDVAPARPSVDDAELDDELRAMVSMWRDVIETAAIGPDDDFFEVGGHSIAGMRLLSRIKREHDVNLALSVLYSDPTPRALLARVRGTDGVADRDGAGFRYLVPITQGNDDRCVLHIIHGAGGNVLNFRDLAQVLAPRWSVVGVQASGVDGVAPPHATMDEMCEAYIAELLAERRPGPMFIAGFSGGGIIAYEIAVRLSARGHPVAAVILLDTFHRSIQSRRRTVGEHAAALLRQGPGYLLERIRVRRQRRLYERADEVVEAATPADGAVPHELRDAHLVSNIRSILDEYETPAYDGPVWLFAANDVLDVIQHAGPDRGWSRSATRLEVTRVPGGHADFILAPHVQQLGEAILDRLDSAVAADQSDRADA